MSLQFLGDYEHSANLAFLGLAPTRPYVPTVLIICPRDDQLAIEALRWPHRAILLMVLHQVAVAVEVLAELARDLTTKL